MKETMTIHKALSELKILNARIEKSLDDIDFVTTNKHSNAKIYGMSVKEHTEQTREQYTSVRTLINRRNAIKYAITRSNAVTEVEIAGKKYTVAEAIDMKSVGQEYLRRIVDKIRKQYIQAQRLANAENGEKLELRADKHLEALFSGADTKSMADEIKKARDNFIEQQTVELIDPIGAAKEIERLTEQIESFASDVDSALSVSNALTTIDVEYDIHPLN